MKEYIDMQEARSVKKLAKCTCDRCGKIIDIDDDWSSIGNKYTNIEMRFKFISDSMNFSRVQFQLCTQCVLGLLDFFETRREVIEEIKEEIDVWID